MSGVCDAGCVRRRVLPNYPYLLSISHLDNDVTEGYVVRWGGVEVKSVVRWGGGENKEYKTTPRERQILMDKYVYIKIETNNYF